MPRQVLHKESVIGLKKLSQADLGLSEKSNQTHIGLFEKTLYFIDDLHLVDEAYLYYNGREKKLICLLDYIENPDGTFRSPKIRLGNTNELNYRGAQLNSIVGEIRTIVSKFEADKQWYILWFGQDSGILFFILFEYRSEFFDLLSYKLHGVGNRHQFEPGSNKYFRVLESLKSIIEIK